MSEQSGEGTYRKSGNLENAADALALVEWFSSEVCDEYEDSFGRGVHVDVEISVSPINGGNDD